ncbi:MAG: phospholipase D-like domain-containing protein [Sulfurovum sp.]|nr:phospholipase D-like domain-containing protein [Sulfurovum sp.]
MKQQEEITYKEILARKYHDYYSDDNYALFDVQKLYYPYFKVTCNCIYREKNKISPIEEAFLKAIECGIKEYASLQHFLALDKEVFEEIAGKIHVENLFIEQPTLVLTEAGKKLLEHGSKLSSVPAERFVILDGITGEACNINMMDDRKNDTSKEKNNLRIQIPYPKNETLNQVINHKALQTILFETLKSENAPEREIYEIKEIGERPYKFHKQLYALFFKNSENPKKVLVIKDGEVDALLTDKLSELESTGKNLFDFSKENEKDHKEQEKEPTIYEYAEVWNLVNGQQLGTYEHPKFFEYLFKYSKKEIIVISPWIKWEVVGNKQKDIENALKRGVKIRFSYGMGKADDLDKESKDFFLKMQQNYKNLLHFATNSHSDHSKVIICDRDWMITTSFNWTSFKGDINREKRGERGSFINDKNAINTVLKEYVK